MSPRFKYPLTLDQILELLIDRFEPTVIIEEATGDIAAYANLYDFNDETCWLGNVIVSPSHRGRGASEVLINSIIEKIKDKYKINKLLLSCHSTNSRGLAFYSKHHFRPFDLKVIKFEDARKVITIQMERELN
ncbi:GNAT family N-acetyltransferase [Cohnella panacarvi]|uniref:GNAT family N-acetyltransferase n=1 Tax=Cohnella panacarvi TaxID=400776 RepID=UPI001FDF8C7F|nr:GNAT family N-acetyltransferase [Cohnella panacarvi]